MTTAAAQPPHARLFALLLFFGVPALLLTLSALNALQVEDDSLVVAEKEFQLSSLMHRLTAPAKDGKPLDLSEIYLPGGSAPLASASLQQYLTQVVATASGKLIETAVLETDVDADRSAKDRVSVRASFEIDNQGLLGVLHGLETGLPLVFVDKISIRRLGGEAVGAGTDRVRVDVEVSGRWRVVTP